VVLPDPVPARVLIRLHHDENVEVYVNGTRVLTRGGYTTSYESEDLSAMARAALRTGRNVIAVQCHQTAGGQYIDVGLEAVAPE
jgi:hypothetical protein